MPRVIVVSLHEFGGDLHGIVGAATTAMDALELCAEDSKVTVSELVPKYDASTDTMKVTVPGRRYHYCYREVPLRGRFTI